LSDRNGRPARWTVILGVNGTGKTSLLQLLVGFEQVPYRFLPGETWLMPRLAHSWDDLQTFLRGGAQEASWSVKLATSNALDVPPIQVLECRYEFRLRVSREPSASAQGGNPPWCCGYGAGRRIGTVSLADSERDNPAASLFSDKADLRNPEE